MFVFFLLFLQIFAGNDLAIADNVLNPSFIYFLISLLRLYLKKVSVTILKEKNIS